MPGIASILDIGRGALFTSQTALQVTGNNIANVDTPGYSRQAVRQEESIPLDYRPGQLGTGVTATEVIRHFDAFLEEQYNDKASKRERFDNLWETLKTVESLFNESRAEGMNSSMSKFFQQWQELSLRPEDFSTREALIGSAQNLATLITGVDRDLAQLQAQMDDFLNQEVEDVNQIMSDIAEINVQIGIHDQPGSNNANTLKDNRDQLVRQLAEKLDIDTIDGGGSDFKVYTTAGHTLVDGANTFEFKYEGPRSYASLEGSSTFDGDIQFDGEDSFEYTIEVTSGGFVSNASTAAQFRVSLDGGQTWIKNDDGTERHFYARPDSMAVDVGNLQISFANATTALTQGDKFIVMPKSGLYWYENTSSFMNVTPEMRFDGTDNPRRVVGGKIAGYFQFRDEAVGTYRDKLSALTETLIWEVNRMHSQGAGLTKQVETLGTYTVRDTSLSLGSDSSGLAFGDKLQAGNAMMYFYDSSTDTLASSASFGPIDFDAATLGIQNFDPTQHSLEDVRNALNNTFGTYLTASITNDRLHIQADTGYTFAFGTDTAGIWAGLGINTFYEGESPATLSVHSDVSTNLNHINAGSINGGSEGNSGDNDTALAIAELEHKDVNVSTTFESGSNQTLAEYYNLLVSKVGSDTANANYQYAYNKALADELDTRQQSIAGVNLDEEMSNLIKYQHSYTAAAKLISTADQMLQTILGMKQ